MKRLVTIKVALGVYRTRQKEYVAEIGQLSATGATVTEAKVAAAKELEQLARHYSTRRYIVTSEGEIFAVYYSGYGRWAYDIVGPGRQWPSATIGFGSAAEAVEAAKRHAASAFGGVVAIL